MKKIALIILLITTNTHLQAQHYLSSKPCHLNVNDPSTSGASRKECIDATFKYAFVQNSGADSRCTGTLINRNTDDGAIGFYFITGRHCFYHNSTNTIL